ncbi:nacht and tpr domain-containing protein [Durotheca rogersii]|uniref:nacht and tpr domain-containing protein n=1 Tax=Durotheca rogersii TaxID=419775 RepID=UPI00221EFDB9|nr:nacht and tpr domain-containing protein [Durotheca rogersii]KAI5859460.1 nacht and tpr domain-containing protein [Durotheca rogersii]
MAHKLEAMWQNAADNFLKKTGKSIRKNPPTTLESCVAAVERSRLLGLREPEAESNADKATAWGMYVIKCLQVFGGITSQAADMAFPASSMCFNAISLLLDIPQEIHEFHTAVNGLFEAIGPTLSHFKMYDQMEQFDNLDSELLLAIQEMMICFVDICALSIVLRESTSFRTKLKIKAKLLLLKDDSGVRDQLNRLKTLSQSHSQVQGTQILKLAADSNSQLKRLLDRADRTEQAILETHANITILKDSDDERKREEGSRNRLRMINEKLGISTKVEEPSTNAGDELWKAAASGTGEWIWHQPEFQKWADGVDSNRSNILFLSGGPNTGKTFLTSVILHQLRGKCQYGGVQSSRILIGSYFFSSNKKGSGKDDENWKPLHTAIKAMACQLAEQDSAFEKALSEVLGKEEVSDVFLKDATCAKLWELLGVGSPRGRATHYLLFDGLADLGVRAREAVGQLMDIIRDIDQTKPSVRVLVSMRPDSLEPRPHFRHLEINVEQHNGSDLRGYVDDTLKKMDILQESDDDSTRIRESVLKKLSTQMRGNYYKVNTALESLRNIVDNDGTEEQVERVLEASREDQNAILQAQINELQLALGPQDICELNELLKWAIFVKFNNLTVELLKAALFLRFRKHSIQPLGKKMRTKYAKIFNVSDDGSVEVVDGMAACLIKPRTEPRNMDETPRFSATITITKGDRTSVQSFFWKLANEINRYDLDDDTGTKNTAKENIQVNEFEAHLTIVRRILQLISEDPNPKTEALGLYALSFLPDHLNDLKNLETPNGPDILKASEKREIGDGLIRLFLNTRGIEKHWDICKWVMWFGDKREIGIFLKWLGDKSVTGHLGPRDSQWVKDVARDKKPERLVLLDIMKMLAKRWLRDDSWRAPKVFRWLHGYLTMIGFDDDGGRPNTGRGTAPSDDAAQNSGSEEVTVTMVEDWCRKHALKEAVPDSLWYQRLGDTYYHRDESDLAISSYQKAIELSSQDPSGDEGLTISLGGNPGNSRSTQADATAGLAKNDMPQNKTRLISIYLRLSEWHYQLHQPEPAIKYVNQVLDLMPSQAEALYRLLRSCLMNGHNEGYAKVWHRLTNGPDDKRKPGSLTEILQQLIADDASDELIMRLFSFVSAESGDSLFLLEEIKVAIALAQSQGQSYVKAGLLLYEGAARHYFQDDTVLGDADIGSWNRCLESCSGFTGFTRSWPGPQATRLISAYHFDRARAETNPSGREKHIRDLRTFVGNDLPFILSPAKTYLASFYVLSEARSRGEDVLQGIMSSGLDALSDDVSENDREGYGIAAAVLLSCRDDLNALSAFSHLLCKPPGPDVLGWLLDFDSEAAQHASRDVQAAVRAQFRGPQLLSEQLGFALGHVDGLLSSSAPSGDGAGGAGAAQGLEEVRARLRQLAKAEPGLRVQSGCDGPCERKWDFENPVYACRYCLDTIFCGECLQRVRRGDKIFTFRGLACNATHDWLCLPRREKQEWIECLMGNVRVGGRLEGGVRVGGELASVSEWLGTLRRKWGAGNADESD